MLARKVSLKDKAEVKDKPPDSNLQGEDRQKSKASAPRMPRNEPTRTYSRRLYDLPVLSVAGTLSAVWLINPDELTPVNDSGAREQPTHMQLEV